MQCIRAGCNYPPARGYIHCSDHLPYEDFLKYTQRRFEMAAKKKVAKKRVKNYRSLYIGFNPGDVTKDDYLDHCSDTNRANICSYDRIVELRLPLTKKQPKSSDTVVDLRTS